MAEVLALGPGRLVFRLWPQLLPAWAKLEGCRDRSPGRPVAGQGPGLPSVERLGPAPWIARSVIGLLLGAQHRPARPVALEAPGALEGLEVPVLRV